MMSTRWFRSMFVLPALLALGWVGCGGGEDSTDKKCGAGTVKQGQLCVPTAAGASGGTTSGGAGSGGAATGGAGAGGTISDGGAAAGSGGLGGNGGGDGSSKLVNGASCSSELDCASGYCLDGHCCETGCGTCQSCGITGSKGSCAPVVSGDDPDSCTGTSTCDAAGTCKSKNGQACTGAASCANGVCKDGYCCDGACTGTCRSCALPGMEGTCATLSNAQDPDSCVGGESCDSAGGCKKKSGQACSSGAECLSGGCSSGKCICKVDADCAGGTCQTRYSDKDGDGYGNAGAPVKHCSTATTTGDVTNSTDCCDADAKRNPGATKYEPLPSTACGTTWDYNCDGLVSKYWTELCGCQDASVTCSGCVTGPWDGTNFGWIGSVPNCGQTASTRSSGCSNAPSGGCAATQTVQGCLYPESHDDHQQRPQRLPAPAGLPVG